MPEAERERAAEVLLRILNGALLELAQLHAQAGKLAPLESGCQTQAFMTQAVLALSAISCTRRPMAFELEDFKQVQASVFQVARVPGQNVVYLGCLLLIWVFCHALHPRRRLWVWAGADGTGAQATWRCHQPQDDGHRPRVRPCVPNCWTSSRQPPSHGGE